uniref:cuticle collagen 7-like n=1 Tax=Nyctereutes procyonoides TaxID=34880 RepID=UPI002444F6B3|nr:cuticle collagen 7-like [Nyctereutes procyonoides]
MCLLALPAAHRERRAGLQSPPRPGGPAPGPGRRQDRDPRKHDPHKPPTVRAGDSACPGCRGEAGGEIAVPHGPPSLHVGTGRGGDQGLAPRPRAPATCCVREAGADLAGTSCAACPEGGLDDRPEGPCGHGPPTSPGPQRLATPTLTPWSPGGPCTETGHSGSRRLREVPGPAPAPAPLSTAP